MRPPTCPAAPGSSPASPSAPSAPSAPAAGAPPSGRRSPSRPSAACCALCWAPSSRRRRSPRRRHRRRRHRSACPASQPSYTRWRCGRCPRRPRGWSSASRRRAAGGARRRRPGAGCRARARARRAQRPGRQQRLQGWPRARPPGCHVPGSGAAAGHRRRKCWARHRAGMGRCFTTMQCLHTSSCRACCGRCSWLSRQGLGRHAIGAPNCVQHPQYFIFQNKAGQPWASERRPRTGDGSPNEACQLLSERTTASARIASSMSRMVAVSWRTAPGGA